MPDTPVPGPAEPELDEQLLDAILAGQELPDDAPEQAHVVADMLASLAGPADPGDLAAEPTLRAAFARAASPAARPGPATPAGPTRPGRRRSWLPIRLSARLGAALAAVLVMLGGTVAAYAGVLPGPIQNLAHRAIDAPPAQTGLTAASLCVAYDRAEARHDAPALAGAFTRLVQAAGDASRVLPYCIEAGKPLTATRPVGQPRSSPASTGLSGQGQHHGQGHRHAHRHGKAKGHHKAKKKAKKKANKLRKAKKAKKKAKKKANKLRKAKKAKKKAKKKANKAKHRKKAKKHHKHKKHKKHKKAKKQKS
jgi:hypothetical protein